MSKVCGGFHLWCSLFFRKKHMKSFFTYQQQILKLKQDGLIIEDEVRAAKDLKLEGYYNIINGYAHIFKIILSL